MKSIKTLLTISAFIALSSCSVTVDTDTNGKGVKDYLPKRCDRFIMPEIPPLPPLPPIDFSKGRHQQEKLLLMESVRQSRDAYREMSVTLQRAYMQYLQSCVDKHESGQ